MKNVWKKATAVTMVLILVLSIVCTNVGIKELSGDNPLMIPAEAAAQTYYSSIGVFCACENATDAENSSLASEFGFTIANNVKNFNAYTANSPRIALGYKTTTDWQQAIKNVIIVARSTPLDSTNNTNTVSYGGRTYHRAGCYTKSGNSGGYTAFTDSYGNLDCGTGSNVYVYLYWTKDAASDNNKAIIGFFTQNTSRTTTTNAAVIRNTDGNSQSLENSLSRTDTLFLFANYFEPTITAPTAKTLTYNDSAQALINGGSATGSFLVYSLAQDGNYSTTIPTGTDAGDYNVWYKVYQADKNTAKSVSVTINKAANPLTYTSTQTVTKTYNASSAQTAMLTAAANAQGTLSYAINSQKNESGTAVSYFTLSGTTLTIAAGTPAGKYTVVVQATAAGNNNYNSRATHSDVTVNVNQAPISPTVTMNGWTYGDTPNDPIISGNTGNGGVTYEYKVSTADDSTYITTKPSDADTYTVRATVDATANYYGGSATTNFTISPAVVEGNTKPSLVNFTLDGIIGANFYYPLDLDSRITKIQFNITNSTAGDQTETISIDRNNTAEVNGTTYLKVTCPITIDKLYGGKITATGQDDNKNVLGQSRTLNIDKYVAAVNSGSYEESMKAVVTTMQQYSRCAQEYTHRPETLTALSSLNSDKTAITQAASKRVYIPSQLILGETVTMRIYVGASEPTVEKTATYFKKEYTLTKGHNDNGYYVDIENVPAFAMLHGFTLDYTVYGESKSLTYYPITYLAQLVDVSHGFDEYTQNLACALYEYAVAVDAQFFSENAA